jgi:hypothetical protein
MTNSKIWLSSPHMGGTEEKYVAEAFASANKVEDVLASALLNA